MKKRIDKHEINLEKGKMLYYQYYGSKFGMWHDLDDEYEKCYVPQEIEAEWKADIISKLEKEILTAQGSDLEVAVSRYINLIPKSSNYLIRLLQSKEMDTFTSIIFCEMLKNDMLKTKNKIKAAHIRSFLDEMKIKLLKTSITIHESYIKDPYMCLYDFSDTNIIARIKAI